MRGASLGGTWNHQGKYVKLEFCGCTATPWFLSQYLTHVSTSVSPNCQLQGFERFTSLSTLWLNSNNLTRLANLDSNIRIKRIYLHDNNLQSLKGSLVNFTFLDTLVLYDNQLADLHGTLPILEQLRHLEELDMHGNPLAEETDYRLHVIKNLPWLHVLDRHVVTDEERLQAANVKTVAEALEEEEKPKALKKKPTAKQRAAATAVKTAVEIMANEVKIRRILLKDHFMLVDRRSEWVIPEERFTEFMRLYNLSNLASSVANDLNIDTYELFLRKYTSRIPIRSSTMGRDPASEVRHIDYVAVCAALEPKFNSRDQDNLERIRASARDLKLGPTLDDKVPLSQTVKNLRSAVTKHTATLKRAAEAERRAMVALSEETARAQRSMRVPMAKSEEDFIVPPDQLSAWEVTELLTLVKSRPSFKGKTCNKSDLREVLDMLILIGRIYTTPAIEAFMEEERLAAEALKEFEDADPEAEETLAATVNPIDRFINEAPHKDEIIDVKEFLSGVIYGFGPCPPPTWRMVTHAEAKSKAKALYKEAKSLEHRVALMGPNEESTRKIKEFVAWGGRLDRIAAGDITHRYNKREGPRIALRGDSYMVKTMKEAPNTDDGGLSDDEDEARDEDDTDQMWADKLKERDRVKSETERLKKRFGLQEDVQSRYRVVRHVRRPKVIERKTHRLITNVGKFERSESTGGLLNTDTMA